MYVPFFKDLNTGFMFPSFEHLNIRLKPKLEPAKTGRTAFALPLVALLDKTRSKKYFSKIWHEVLFPLIKIQRFGLGKNKPLLS